jgi:hypothetical protein
VRVSFLSNSSWISLVSDGCTERPQLNKYREREREREKEWRKRLGNRISRLAAHFTLAAAVTLRVDVTPSPSPLTRPCAHYNNPLFHPLGKYRMRLSYCTPLDWLTCRSFRATRKRQLLILDIASTTLRKASSRKSCPKSSSQPHPTTPSSPRRRHRRSLCMSGIFLVTLVISLSAICPPSPFALP